ncbi:TnsA endonuclease N-terminal domain-containing protein [Burkholderia cenocepacia]|uniref:TnsA endonuclease N-terminal domain-containing protein n=1 Tax=Burkholderia cenocepacia TaxID=95486 RepID=UPI002ABE3ED3|nr:TnsA endonuclease N-terminal domain-containing protein [Burkholderia cenocepacia]
MRKTTTPRRPDGSKRLGKLFHLEISRSKLREVHRSRSVRPKQPVAPTDGPVRDVATRSGPFVRGLFPSFKNGRQVAHEETLEGDAVLLFEMSPLIRSYREQPEHVYYPDGDRTRRYTPDYEIETISGQRILVEIKPANRLNAPQTRRKFDLIEAHLDRTGRAFAILTDKSIRQKPRLNNLRLLWRSAPLTPMSYGEIRRAVRLLHVNDVRSFDDAISVIGRNAVSGLLMLGYLTCSLDSEINRTTDIFIHTENQNAWFFIEAERRF